MAKTEIFSLLHRILLYYPVGQKFTRNRSISYGFRDIHTFFIFRWNPRWLPKLAKIEIFPLCIGYSCTTLWVKNSLKIALSLTVFEIFTLFHFRKNPRWPPKVAKIEIFPLAIGYSSTTLWVKKFTRNRSISYGFRDIHTFFIFR